MKRRQLLTAAAVSAGALSPLLSPLARAQAAYPSKNINYIIPFVAGGESDVVARWQSELFQRKYSPHTMNRDQPAQVRAAPWHGARSIARQPMAMW